MPDRGTYLENFSSFLDLLLLHPVSTFQRAALGIFALLLLTWTLSRLHRWGKAAQPGFFRSLAVVLLSIFFLAVIAAWVGRGLDEFGLVEGQRLAGLGIALGAAFFAGVAPLTRFCLKAAYFTSVAAWMLAGGITGGALYLSKQAWDSAAGAVPPPSRETEAR